MVLLHGFCEDSRVWQQVLPFWEEYTCISVDLPGFGGSGVADQADLSYWANILHTTLNAAQVERVHMLGHSMGGYVALAYAELFPESLRSLSLFHSAAFADSAEKVEARKKQVEFIERLGVKPYVQQLVPSLFASTANPDLIQNQLKQAMEQSAAGIAMALEAMWKRPDRTHVLKTAPYPIHLISGRHDALLALTGQSELAAMPDSCTWSVLNQSGHMGMLEEPETAASVIRKFLDRIA